MSPIIFETNPLEMYWVPYFIVENGESFPLYWPRMLLCGPTFFGWPSISPSLVTFGSTANHCGRVWYSGVPWRPHIDYGFAWWFHQIEFPYSIMSHLLKQISRQEVKFSFYPFALFFKLLVYGFFFFFYQTWKPTSSNKRGIVFCPFSFNCNMPFVLAGTSFTHVLVTPF